MDKPEWLESAEAESAVLAGRHERIKQFIGSTEFTALDDVEQTALRKQEQYMEGYSRVLEGRVARANAELEGTTLEIDEEADEGPDEGTANEGPDEGTANEGPDEPGAD